MSGTHGGERSQLRELCARCIVLIRARDAWHGVGSVQTVSVKALSIRQPWAYLVVSGTKTIENRHWTTEHRGLLLIHAAVSLARDARYDLRRLNVSVPDLLPRGALVGYAELVDVITDSLDPFFVGPFGFVLRNAQPLKKPIPMTGRSGIFEVGQISL